MRRIPLAVGFLLSALWMSAQNPESGRVEYESRCARCHGGDGTGGELGPPIVFRLAQLQDEQLSLVILNGVPDKGMPGFKLTGLEMSGMVSHLRTLRPPRRDGPQPKPATVQTTDGKTLNGMAMNRGPEDLQLLTEDKRLQLLRKVGEKYRRVTSQVDWPTYHGSYSGNRYSPRDAINTKTVSRLAPKWIFTISGSSRLQVTPVVVDGVMYVTNANECYALDPGTGRQIWAYRRPRTRGVIGDAAAGINRGVSVAGDRLFIVTDHAHIIALNRFTGALLWDTEMADWRKNYNATSAPLAVGNLVVSGTAGGDEGVRGFVAAFDQTTGKEVWRFWTVPARGEPLSETWGAGVDTPGATAWFTGTYDPELDTLFWPTGNPGPDLNGDNRPGDNLYSDCILALDAKTGRLKWHYQHTPHDLWDWDSQQPPVLVDTQWNGKPRKLLLHANRNGFFYVLDRVEGKLLLAKPFVKKLTWASAIGADGRPVLNPNQTPTTEGAQVCPAIEGATNWFSTSFSPLTGLYYVQTLEKCNIFRKSPAEWKAGRDFMGGSTRPVPGETPVKILRALDIQTGKIVWELPQTGNANSWGGTLSTAGGLVIFCDDSGALSAADAGTGKLLWTFPTGQTWKASPMTYVFDGKQYVAVAAGPNILSFGLVD
ncbi:MAG: PQQ-binding-like beta-propeller repeat protein [Acidobacteriia bacterium]|nr:PQQ-binding-like beta-propeller repeat protein [Terriglobia bacterium]